MKKLLTIALVGLMVVGLFAFKSPDASPDAPPVPNYIMLKPADVNSTDGYGDFAISTNPSTPTTPTWVAVVNDGFTTVTGSGSSTLTNTEDFEKVTLEASYDYRITWYCRAMDSTGDDNSENSVTEMVLSGTSFPDQVRALCVGTGLLSAEYGAGDGQGGFIMLHITTDTDISFDVASLLADNDLLLADFTGVLIEVI